MNTFCRNISVLLLVILGLSLTSCADVVAQKNNAKSGASEQRTQKVAVGEFDEIEVGQGINVVFSQTDNSGYTTVTACPEAMERLDIRTDGNKLEIFYKKDTKNKTFNKPTIVKVGSRSLTEVEVSSAAVFSIPGSVKFGGKFKIEVSSAGKVNINNIACKLLEIDSSSASSVVVKSLSGSLEADASSSSRIKVSSMQGQVLDVEASSAASIDIEKVRCDKVEAEANSAAKIILAGRCNTFVQDKNSGGSINHAKLFVKI